MQMLTKFWRAKLATVLATLAALGGVWSVLAWDDWTAQPVTASPDEIAAALQYLAAVDAEAAPDPAPADATVTIELPAEEIRRVYVVTRRVEASAGAPLEAPPPAPPAQAPPSAPAIASAPQQPRSAPVQRPAPAAPPPAPKPAPAPAPKPAPVESKGS